MNFDIVESFAQMVRDKGIDKDVLAGILEEIFGLLVRKKYGEEVKYDVVVNMDRGDIEIFLEREIVDVVEDPNTQISLDEVNVKGNPDELEVGEDYVEKIQLATLGRRLITLAKQSLNQKIRELEKDLVYNEYKELLGEIVVGDIYQIRKTIYWLTIIKMNFFFQGMNKFLMKDIKKVKLFVLLLKKLKKGTAAPLLLFRVLIICSSEDYLKLKFLKFMTVL